MHSGRTKCNHEIRMKNADEYDALKKAPLCVFKNNTGLRKMAKRHYNKRRRASVKFQLKEEKMLHDKRPGQDTISI